jgi:hypothetical protein
MHWLLILPCLALFSCGRYGAFLLLAFLLRAFLLRAVRVTGVSAAGVSVAGGTCCGRFCCGRCGVAGNSGTSACSWQS